jgi:hypothetical protein
MAIREKPATAASHTINGASRDTHFSPQRWAGVISMQKKVRAE